MPLQRWAGSTRPRAAYSACDPRLDPRLAAAHANQGLLLLQQSRVEEALRLLVRAVGLDPDRPVYWQHLAEVYGGLEQYHAAIQCWKRVLALTSEDRASLHLALGQALEEANRLDEAEEHYRIAATLEPDSSAPWVHLGVLDQARGEFARAEASYRAAIQLEPAYDPAHARLAMLLGGALPAADLEALTERLSEQGTDTERRVGLLFAMAQVLDARGEYPRAARYFREANALNLTLARGHRRFRPAEQERSVDDLIRAFTPEFFARIAGAGLDTRQPVFIVGLPRSGTTLLEQVLARHPRVHGAGELLLGRRVYESLPQVIGSSAPPEGCVAMLGPATIRHLAHAYSQRLRALIGGRADRADRVVDKKPENYFYLGLLAAMFPGATIIHCRRTLRDVALSCWMAHFHSVIWASHPGDIAVNFRSYLRIMDHWRTVLPATIHEFDYEETVSDLEAVARRLLAALGLDWDPGCLDFQRNSSPVRTASNIQVRQPLHRRSIARWKHYEHELADLFAALPREVHRPTRAAIVAVARAARPPRRSQPFRAPAALDHSPGLLRADRRLPEPRPAVRGADHLDPLRRFAGDLPFIDRRYSPDRRRPGPLAPPGAGRPLARGHLRRHRAAGPRFLSCNEGDEEVTPFLQRVAGGASRGSRGIGLPQLSQLLSDLDQGGVDPADRRGVGGEYSGGRSRGRMKAARTATEIATTAVAFSNIIKRTCSSFAALGGRGPAPGSFATSRGGRTEGR